MQQIRWLGAMIGLSLFSTACAAALGEFRLEGLESLTNRSRQPAGPPIDRSLQETRTESEAPIEAPAETLPA